MIVSGGNQVIYHDSATYQLKYSHGEYIEPVLSLEWSYDKKYLLVVGPSGSVEIFKPTNISTKSLQKIRVSTSSAAAFYKATHRYVAVGCTSGRVTVWDTKSQTVGKQFTTTNSSVTAIDVSYTDTHMAAGCANGDVVLYGLNSVNKMNTYRVPDCKSTVTSVHFSPHSTSILASTSEAGNMSLWNIVKNKPDFIFTKAHSSICSDLTFSPINNYFMVSVGYDCIIKMYDVRTKQPVGLQVTEDALTSVDMSKDGDSVACADRNGRVLIFDLRNMTQPLANLKAHKGVVNSVRYQNSDYELPALADVSIEPNRVSWATDSQPSDSAAPVLCESPQKPLSESNVTKSSRLSFFDMLRDQPRNSGDFSDIESMRSDILNHTEESGLTQHKLNHPVFTFAVNQNLNNFSNIESPSNFYQSVSNIKETSTPNLDNNTPIPPVPIPIIPDPTVKREISNSDVLQALETMSGAMAAFQETRQDQMYDVLRQMRTHFMQLRMFICKNHIEQMDKMATLESASSTDIEGKMKIVQAENENLKAQVAYLESEREKYLRESKGEF